VPPKSHDFGYGKLTADGVGGLFVDEVNHLRRRARHFSRPAGENQISRAGLDLAELPATRNPPWRRGPRAVRPAHIEEQPQKQHKTNRLRNPAKRRAEYAWPQPFQSAAQPAWLAGEAIGEKRTRQDFLCKSYEERRRLKRFCLFLLAQKRQEVI
jgi:hypothetical protein